MSGANTSTSSLYSNSYQYQNGGHSESYSNSSKALQAKALGTSAGADNADLRGWMEQAYAYYSAVQNGSEPQPDQYAWQEFLSQMDWASKQLGESPTDGADWGMTDPGSSPDNSPQGMASDPFGGMPGTMNNYVYTEEQAHIGFTGNGVRDIWSNDVTLDVAPMSAQVTTELTTDTRTNPPEDVIKVTVKDSATGTEATYFIHNYQDAHIKINTPGRDAQVTNNAGDFVTVGKFSKDQGKASNEVSAPFEEQDNGDLLVEVPYGDSIQFKPQGGGEDQTWDVYGNFDIAAKPSDKIQVNKSADPDGGYEIVVTHKDGSTDTYKIHKGFHGNISGYPENVQWGDPANGGTVGEDIPSDYSEDITLNTQPTADSASSKPSTPADHVEGDTATYNTASQVEIYADYGDAVKNHDITTPGEVILHGSSYADSVSVTKDANGKYVITVYKNGITDPNDPQYKVETYTVDGSSKITLDFMPDKISGSNADDPMIQKGVGANADPSNQAGKAVADQLAQLSGMSMTADEIMEKAKDMGIDLEILPTLPTSHLMDFLVAIDPKLAQMISDLNDAVNSKGKNSDRAEAIRTQVRNRLVELYSILYPDAGVQATGNTGNNLDNIMFNGVEYDVVANANGNNHFGFTKQSS